MQYGRNTLNPLQLRCTCVQVMYAWRNALDSGSASPVKDLFGLTMRTTLKCTESDETLSETTDAFSLKCNIKVDINHLNEGLKLAMVDDREKNSEALGRSALWSGEAKVCSLPQYLTVQLMRFFYKVDTQNKAKILRKVRSHTCWHTIGLACGRMYGPCALRCSIWTCQHI